MNATSIETLSTRAYDRLGGAYGVATDVVGHGLSLVCKLARRAVQTVDGLQQNIADRSEVDTAGLSRLELTRRRQANLIGVAAMTACYHGRGRSR